LQGGRERRFFLSVDWRASAPAVKAAVPPLDARTAKDPLRLAGLVLDQ
jgi:hypothetical protein